MHIQIQQDSLALQTREAKYLCDVLEEVIPRRRAMSCMWLKGQNTARHFSLKGEQ